MTYQNPKGTATGHAVVPGVDYEKVRDFILQVLEESAKSVPSMDEGEIARWEEDGKENNVKEVKQLDMNEDVMCDIMAALCMFR